MITMAVVQWPMVVADEWRRNLLRGNLNTIQQHEFSGYTYDDETT